MKSVLLPWLAALVCLFSTTACQTSGIRDALAAVEGEFVQRPEGVFYSNNAALVDAVKSAAGTPTARTLSALADCMRCERETKSVFRGSPVPLSWVCYQAMENFAYYEKTDGTGDIVPWPGYVDLPASREALGEAGKAWKEVISTRTWLWH
ncbi:MAG: hypothetical protein LBP58_05820 [Azoarcus sp.]|jgi:hypothetical protein|nr:hypothetical protein [Azoarcus sp.]